MENSNVKMIVVNTNTLSIWDFCTDENKNEKMQNAIDSDNKSLATYEQHLINYPDNAEYWNNRITEIKNTTFEVMTYDDFIKLEKEHYLNKPLHEITEVEFMDALECLPPLQWQTINGTNEFLMSEFYTGTFTTQYARKQGKYYSKMVDATDKNTWIHNLI